MTPTAPAFATVASLAQRVEATTGPAAEEFAHFYRDYSSITDGVRCETGPAMRAHFIAVQALGGRLSEEFDRMAAERGLDTEGERIADQEDEFIAQTREDLHDFKARIIAGEDIDPDEYAAFMAEAQAHNNRVRARSLGQWVTVDGKRHQQQVKELLGELVSKYRATGTLPETTDDPSALALSQIGSMIPDEWAAQITAPVTVVRVPDHGLPTATVEDGANHVSYRRMASLSDLMHEYAHVCERDNPDLLMSSVAYRASITAGGSVEGSQKMVGDQRVSEKMLVPAGPRDGWGWKSGYVGKVYQNTDGDDTATEVLSVGLERLTLPRTRLSPDQEHHRRHVLGVLVGV